MVDSPGELTDVHVLLEDLGGLAALRRLDQLVEACSQAHRCSLVVQKDGTQGSDDSEARLINTTISMMRSTDPSRDY
jgi:hypothetical protein